MNLKLLIFLAWMFLLAFHQTADDFWRFCLVYTVVLTICAYFFKMENRSSRLTKKKKTK